MNSPTENSRSTGTNDSSRCSRRVCSSRVAAPVSVSRPRYTCRASALMVIGRSSRTRSRSARAIATPVLPTPVGPNRAMTSVPCPGGIKPYPRATDISGVRRMLTLLIPLCLLAGAAIAATPAVAKKRSCACARLSGHDYAKSRSLKLIEKRVGGGETDLKGCRLGSEVHVFAIRLQGGAATADFTVHSVGDRWALVSARTDTPYGSDARTWVFDIDSGRILYTVFRWRCDAGQTDCSSRPPAIAKGIVDQIGKSAFAFTDGSDVTISGYGTDGRHRTFDSAPATDLPAASLTIKRSVANWTHSGEERHAQLP